MFNCSWSGRSLGSVVRYQTTKKTMQNSPEMDWYAWKVTLITISYISCVSLTFNQLIGFIAVSYCKIRCCSLAAVWLIRGDEISWIELESSHQGSSVGLAMSPNKNILNHRITSQYMVSKSLENRKGLSGRFGISFDFDEG